jgi:hypothetical protein
MAAVDDGIQVAVQNNACWCDLVCRSQGITTSWLEGFWVSRQPSRQFYPEAITPQENLSPEQVVDELPAGACSVKDSFADLDIASQGFELLFEARWIYRAPTARTAPQAGWTTVSTERDFVRWRGACGWADVLPAALLRDESVRFLQRKRAQAVSAGAVLNRSDSVVGLTNLSTGDPLDQVWGDVAVLCGQHFPPCPIVGYQRGRDLDAAINTGFTDLAALRVWLQVQ